MAFYRASIGGGGGGSGWTEVEAVSLTPQSATLSLSNLTVGHLYHLFVSSAGSSQAYAESNMAITANSGTSGLTLVDKATARASSYYSSILHYTFTATSTTAVFNRTNTRYMGYIIYDTQ